LRSTAVLRIVRPASHPHLSGVHEPLMLTSAELRKRLDLTGSQLDGLRGYL